MLSIDLGFIPTSLAFLYSSGVDATERSRVPRERSASGKVVLT